MHGYYEVWTAPASGGPATRRAVFDLPTDIAVVIPFGTAGTLYVSVYNMLSSNESGIYRLPPDGGEPQLVPGSKGYTVAPRSPGAWVSPAAKPRSADLLPTGPGVPQLEYWNVETGERRQPVTLTDVTRVQCTPETCLGSADTGLVAYSYDGTRITRLTGGPTPADHEVPSIISTIDGSGRFITSRWSAAGFLVDLTTHTAATLPSGFLGALFGDETVTLRRTGGQQFLLDLTRIP
jgi:hypothetical protein